MASVGAVVDHDDLVDEVRVLDQVAAARWPTIWPTVASSLRAGRHTETVVPSASLALGEAAWVGVTEWWRAPCHGGTRAYGDPEAQPPAAEPAVPAGYGAQCRATLLASTRSSRAAEGQAR